MPKVEIGTAYGVTIRIEANEASVEELRKQAMDSFREACEIERGQPTGPAGGVQVERRGTPQHGIRHPLVPASPVDRIWRRMMAHQLPPFPVDDATLDLLDAAVNPWQHGDPDAERSSLHDFLTMMSQLGGSDTNAAEEAQLDEHERIRVMRDPVYSEHAVITALIEEIRRLRGGS